LKGFAPGANFPYAVRKLGDQPVAPTSSFAFSAVNIRFRILNFVTVCALLGEFFFGCGSAALCPFAVTAFFSIRES